MDGWVTVNYLRSEQDGETFTSAEQRVRLNWRTALSNADLLNLYFQYSMEEDSNPDQREMRPLGGFTLVGPEYRLLAEYRELIDKNFEEDGFTLTTKTFFTNLTLNYGPDYPELIFDFSRTQSKDDLEEPETDYVETDFGVRATYDNGPWSLRYTHRENIFDNNLNTLAPISLNKPIDVATDVAGTIYVTEDSADRVFRFSPSGAFLGEFGRFGSGEGQFRDPAGIATSPDFIYVVDSGNNRVEQFDFTGTFIAEWGFLGNDAGEFDDPYGIAIDPTGVYVTDRGNDRLQKFTLDGRFLFSIRGFNSPSGVASNGSLIFVADTQNHRIQVFTIDGAFVNQWGSFGPSVGQFEFPTGVAVDASNHVYVTDSDNNRVQVFTASGAFLETFGMAGSGDGEFSLPQGITISPAQDVIVADTGNSRIQVFTNNGVFRFAIGEVSSGERGKSTELALNTFNVIYSRQLFTGVYASVDYDLFLSDQKDKDTGEDIISSQNHDITGELRLLPYRWVSFTSIFDLRFFNTTSGDVETNLDEFTQTHILAVQLMPKINLSTSYTRDDQKTNNGPDQGSDFTTVSLNMFPTNRVNVNLSYSDLQNREDGETTQKTNTVTAATDMILYRGIDLNMLYSNSTTKDYEADGTIDTQRIRGLLRLVPRPSMTLNTTAEYSTSNSSFAGEPETNTDTVTGSLDFTWGISERLDLLLSLDFINTDTDGLSTNTSNYLSDLVWRMNDYLTFFLGYRGGSDEDDVMSFRTQARFPFVWDSRLTVDFEIEQGQETDNRFLFVEMTKFF